MVHMIVVGEIPVVDHHAGCALRPYVNGAASERFALPGFERLAVGSMGDAVVFPHEIVETLPVEATKGLELLLLEHLLSAGENRERLGFSRSEVGLENHDVALPQWIAIRINGLAQQLRAS